MLFAAVVVYFKSNTFLRIRYRKRTSGPPDFELIKHRITGNAKLSAHTHTILAF